MALKAVSRKTAVGTANCIVRPTNDLFRLGKVTNPQGKSRLQGLKQMGGIDLSKGTIQICNS